MIKQFRAGGCLSYCLFDQTAKVAALVDPHSSLLDEYRAFLGEQGFRLSWLVDTHTHTDHYSATHVLAKDHGAWIGMSARTKSARSDRRLSQGERLELGQQSWQVLELPGHTEDGIGLYQAEKGVLLSGDTLLIGASGRTDFPDADSSLLWKSLVSLTVGLPPETIVFPAHDYKDLICTSIGVELQRNLELKHGSLDRFIALREGNLIANLPAEVRHCLDFNLSKSPAELPWGIVAGGASQFGLLAQYEPRFGSIPVEKFRHKIQEQDPGNAFVDVRERSEFLDGHVPGMINIPLSEIGFHLAELKGHQRVYVSCLTGHRSAMAAATLSYLGLGDVVNVAGGFKAWTQNGFKVEK